MRRPQFKTRSDKLHRGVSSPRRRGGKRAFTQTDVTRAITALKKAGFDHFEIVFDGFSARVSTENRSVKKTDNEWDSVL